MFLNFLKDEQKRSACCLLKNKSVVVRTTMFMRVADYNTMLHALKIKTMFRQLFFLLPVFKSSAGSVSAPVEPRDRLDDEIEERVGILV